MASTLCILIFLSEMLKPRQKFCSARILTQQNFYTNNDVFKHIYMALRKKCTSPKA